jgi:micrococcal nuclease
MTLRAWPKVSEIHIILRRLFIGLLAFLSLGACEYSVSSGLGTVERVIDGDSVRVSLGGQQLEVRLAGIDAPEYQQPFGDQAKDTLTALVSNQAVRLIAQEQDRYGRTVALLVRAEDELDINAELVRQGAAWVHPKFGDPRWFLLERQARGARRGLWGAGRPVAPWDWRREHGTTYSRK